MAALLDEPSWEFDPGPIARPHGTCGSGPVRRTGAEHAGQRLAQVALGMGTQLVAARQVEPGEHHDLIARPQVLGTLRDLLIEADPRPRRAVALVRRIVEDPQGRLHPPDRHQAVARLHNNSLLVRRGHGPHGCPDGSLWTAITRLHDPRSCPSNGGDARLAAR